MDTHVFIYQLDENIRYLHLTDHIFRWLEAPSSRAVTSTITMTELLAGPYKDPDDQRVDHIYGLLSTYPNLEWVPPGLPIADEAARLRARYRLRTPDALQAATAVHSGATGFITNDGTFDRVTALQVLVLDSLL
ncbi:MAG: PIN domain-containing protein [Acidobacteria bacterium]|nr:PIN domain-containing protein [Acidobacteriota bacterium]